MDTAMRDLERLEEQREDEAPGRKLGTLMVAALATVALVFAMAAILGGDSEAEASADPLAALDRAAALEGSDELGQDGRLDSPLEVDREALSFPEALAHYDARPEVEAALVAAEAELAHPDPIPAGVALGDVASGTIGEAPIPSPSRPVVAMEDGLPSILPAGTAAGSAPEVIARAAPRDALVASALPTEPSHRVASGRDGEYTLQVISYQNDQDAEIFADGLRARGHHAFVVSATIPERGRFFRVRVGPFESMREAETYRHQFELDERMNTIVVRRRDQES
jgi:cell division septation protein DedD